MAQSFSRPSPLSGFGLARLPQPSDGDIFLDFEGDPFVDEGGLEFHFLVTPSGTPPVLRPIKPTGR
jgi:hypothetical protein